MTGPDGFRFLSVERRLSQSSDWNRADWPKLWLYNAHYFDDLIADDFAKRVDWHRAIIARWIAENPPGQGAGWEPYPVSLRLVNWAKWLWAGATPIGGMAESIAVQTRWLRRRLEHHLLGNHLWANAKALVFAGCLFDGDEATGWLHEGLRLVRRELSEQVLADGGHFERSPMYHAIVLEDVLDLLQLAQRFPNQLTQANVAVWQACAVRMLRWLRVMSHPDGGIAFFNDAAFGVAQTYEALSNYATALGVAVEAGALSAIEPLAASGYVRLQAGDAVLIADVGDIGPDYLPGHAHADTLSFELSLRGQRVLVNSGTSTYERDALRAWQRGTAAHNSVLVDGCDSSEVWASFRVARRARAFQVSFGADGDECWLKAAHDGYQRLPGRVIHRRAWRLSSSSLQIDDSLDGVPNSVVARFHFAPDKQLPWSVSDAAGQLETARWYPRFGEHQANSVLCVRPTTQAWTTCFFLE